MARAVSAHTIRTRCAHSGAGATRDGAPRYGWVTFDPTPAGAAPSAGGWARVGLYVDAMREFWREWIVNYDFAHQRTIGTQVTSSTRQFVERGRWWVRQRYFALLRRTYQLREQARRSPAKWLTTTLVILAVALLALFARRL